MQVVAHALRSAWRFLDKPASVHSGPVWDQVRFDLRWHAAISGHQLVVRRLPVSMQLTYEKLPAQLRRSSRLRKLTAVLLTAYAVKKLSPYVWRRLQVHTHLYTQRSLLLNETLKLGVKKKPILVTRNKKINYTLVMRNCWVAKLKIYSQSKSPASGCRFSLMFIAALKKIYDAINHGVTNNSFLPFWQLFSHTSS